MEEPAFLHKLGDLTQARVLDLRCGTAALGHQVLDFGAADALR